MRSLFLGVVSILVAAILPAQENAIRTRYEIKQAAGSIVYLNGGATDGLGEGMRLRVYRLAPGDALVNRKEIGEITVSAVASNSTACEPVSSSSSFQAGDHAELSEADTEAIRLTRTSKTRRKYAQVVSFTDGDPVEAELREYVPRPPLPEVNRVRGRIAFEQNGIIDHTGGSHTFQEGVVLRADMTRIGGSYWNFTGYWRGRLNSSSNAFAQQTLNDLLSRTYHIELTYNNPASRYTAGFGRLLLPWAPSLNTIDGGYFARRMAKHVTTGIFGGSTPDPTAWNYDPHRQMFGVFTSFDAGSFETVRYMGTVGAAASRSHWRAERNFLFFENNLLVGNRFFVFHNLEADKLSPQLVADHDPKPRIARSFLTVRLQLNKHLSVDVNNNYFRGVPTFDERLIGTGLLDKMLFQGWSGGFRLELPHSVSVYTNLGANKRENESKASLNYMGGLSLARIPKFPFRTDLRYSHFNSSFGTGSYESISLTREIGENLRVEFLGGEQRLASQYSGQSHTRFVNANVDYLLGRHYVLGGGWTAYRGRIQDYDQFFFNLGYRF